MEIDVEGFVAEVRSIKENCVRPKYPASLKSKAVELLKLIDLPELADMCGLDRNTLKRWAAAAGSNQTPLHSASPAMRFAPVVKEESLDSAEKVAESGAGIRLDVTYRDGRRMLIELPATASNATELLATLRRDFFRGGC